MLSNLVTLLLMAFTIQALPVHLLKRALITTTVAPITTTMHTTVPPDGYQTVTTEIDGVLGTYLQQVVTSYSSRTTVSTSFLTSELPIESTSPTLISESTTSESNVLFTTTATPTTPTSITPSTTVSITMTPSTSSTTSSSFSSNFTPSYFPYTTQAVEGTCYVMYAEDTVVDDTPYTTITLTRVVATVTVTDVSTLKLSPQ